MSDIPENYKLIYNAQQIAAQTKSVAAEVSEWVHLVQDRKREPLLAVCVLRGAVFFFADLLRQIDCSVEVAFCRAQSYAPDLRQKAGKGVRVAVDDVPAAGRHILIVDDICDTGLTLLKLHNVFLELGAKSVRSAVLIHREVEDSKYEPTWNAFNYRGMEWFVGYGLEDGDRNRNLSDVYVIER